MNFRLLAICITAADYVDLDLLVTEHQLHTANRDLSAIGSTGDTIRLACTLLCELLQHIAPALDWFDRIVVLRPFAASSNSSHLASGEPDNADVLSTSCFSLISHESCSPSALLSL